MNTETLMLTGSGYNLTITEDALKRREDLLAKASTVTAVTSNDESYEAAYHVRDIAAMRIEVDKSRKEIKEPVIRIGKLIDSTAKEFLEDLQAEEDRIKGLIGAHAEDVAKAKAEAEQREREAFEAARAAREAAESGKIADVIAAKQTLAERMAASEEVATTNLAAGVRFAWDFEIEDLDTVYRVAPEFVTLEIKRAAVIAWLKEMESADDNVTGMAASIGIRAFKKPVISTK